MKRSKIGRGETPLGSPAGSIAPEFDPPFDVLEPEDLASPLVFSSPHSGSIYPASFLASSRLDGLSLRRSEDAFVDELFAAAPGLGAPLLRAHFPRAFLDVNREPYELDPRMFDGKLPAYANTRSLRVAGGLGTIARVVGEAQEIYAGRMPVEEAIRRIEGLYKPYHHALRQLMRRASEAHGVAVLIDCHSMPSSAAGPQTPRAAERSAPGCDRADADFILGDRYGTSCGSFIVDLVEYELRQMGYSVQRNKPYAGGFITEHYGSPGAGFHALQIEIKRSLYMDERTLQKLPAFAAVSADLTRMTRSLMRQVNGLGDGRALAAE
ncbi:MAG: N-formylglutamate amidohydrolase [Hyphomicrobiales bacterium]|nr:N-formylglutamate amidohydrolase [Hyphomicrobiales bacterium]